ncbi:MAG: oligosaccharide flippase family protein [Methylomarinum sp.]|nr:oligosaccharide flippase family protein [Methylomarinum sp.]
MSIIRRSFFWSAVEQIGFQLSNIIIFFVLARLLEPADFGLIGMMALFVGLANLFADSGFSSALIQRKTLSLDDETSVFALNIIAGLILAILLYLIAPLVAQFYNQPILIPLLTVNALIVVISSLVIVQQSLLQRNMQFKRIAAITTVSTIISGGAGILMAYSGFGVWSLLGQSITAVFIRLLLFWSLSPWRPRGRVRLQNIRSMFGYSVNILGAQMIGVVYQNMYSVIIGKVYSVENLGYYNRANSLRMIPVSILIGIVQRVTFPYFSKHQDDKELLLKSVREIIRSTIFLSASGLTLLIIIADSLIPLLLTEKWEPIIPFLRILCCAAVITPISSLNLSTLQALGYAHLNFKIEMIKMIYGVIVVAVIFRYGINVLAWSVVATAVISYFINVWYSVRLIGYRWRMQAFDLLPSIILCAGSGGATWWIGLLYSVEPFFMIIIECGIFAAILIVGIYFFRNIFFASLWKFISPLV